MKKNAERKAKSGKKAMSIWVLYAILIASIAAYIFYNNVLIGVFAFVVLVLAIVLDVKTSVETGGIQGAFKEIAMAVGAVVLVWIILIAVLGTSSPVDVVVSCSMLPTLQRGDLVVVHGISNLSSFAEENHVPVVNMTQSQFSAMQAGMYSEFLAYYAYYPSNRSDISETISQSVSGYSIGLYNTKCISGYLFEGQYNRVAGCMVSSQSGNPIKYSYSIGNVTINGQVYNEVYTSGISILNTTVSQNYSNPIIIYKTTSSDSFSGDIIHRLYAVIRVGGDYYTLTKGDNNPYLDIEAANYPANQSSIVGYEVARVPYVGYLRLILTGQVGQVPGCNMQLQR